MAALFFKDIDMMEYVKQKRKIFQLCNVFLCIAMLLNRILFCLSAWWTSAESDISVFAYISGFCWMILIGACLYHSTYQKYFDEYTDEQLIRILENCNKSICSSNIKSGNVCHSR